jgi:hypothetical protein
MTRFGFSVSGSALLPPTPLEALEACYRNGSLKATDPNVVVLAVLRVHLRRAGREYLMDDASFVRRCLEHHGIVRYEAETGNPF